MISLINSYLLQHKSVSIPGLGTIYVERIPAQSDFVNRQLIPPAYHYRFDKYLDAPDRSFFSFLSRHLKLSEPEAVKSYHEWAQNLRHSIGTDEPTLLESIGSLKRSPSGDIIFETIGPLKTYDVAVPAERVIRSDAKHAMLVGDRETTTAEMSDYLQDVPGKRTRWWVYLLIALGVVLAVLLYNYFTNGSLFSTGMNQTMETR